MTLFSFLPNFWAKTAGFYRIKMFFLLSGQRGLHPPSTLSGPTTKKKTVFYVSLPLVTEIQGQFKGFAEFNEKNGMLSSNISIITCKIIYEY